MDQVRKLPECASFDTHAFDSEWLFTGRAAPFVMFDGIRIRVDDEMRDGTAIIYGTNGQKVIIDDGRVREIPAIKADEGEG